MQFPVAGEVCPELLHNNQCDDTLASPDDPCALGYGEDAGVTHEGAPLSDCGTRAVQYKAGRDRERAAAAIAAAAAAVAVAGAAADGARPVAAAADPDPAAAVALGARRRRLGRHAAF